MSGKAVVPLRRLERQLFGAWCQWLCYPARSARNEAENRRKFEQTVAVVEEQLGRGGGPYFLGQLFGTADVIFTPYIERMAASLFYYKGYDIKAANPNVAAWFAAMETRDTYCGTQSDYHTHAHDLPPQMGGCYTNGSPEAQAAAAQVDEGSSGVPDADRAEPETATQEAILRVLRHRETIVEINGDADLARFDEALRCALTLLVTGKACAPPKGSDVGLRYLRDRTNVPRDMSLFAARRLRASLEATAAMDGDGQPRPLPTKNRRDQSLTPFREARAAREAREASEGKSEGKAGEQKM
jgi:glutathione S-transferase